MPMIYILKTFDQQISNNVIKTFIMMFFLKVIYNICIIFIILTQSSTLIPCSQIRYTRCLYHLYINMEKKKCKKELDIGHNRRNELVSDPC